MADSPFRELPKVMVAHATFQKALSGPPSEGALSYPIHTFLKVRGASWILDPEQDHPALKEAAKLGRPWQLDLVGRDRRTKRWSFALEIKIHDGRSPDRLVRDFVKLLLLADSKESENAQRYLLVLFPLNSRLIVAQPRQDVPRLAQNVYGKSGEPPVDLFDVLLPWTTSSKRFFIGEINYAIRKDVDKALRQFKKEKVRGDVRIDLIARAWSEDYACGLWQFRWKSPAKQYYLSIQGPPTPEVMWQAAR
jgi:hypothetical protein